MYRLIPLSVIAFIAIGAFLSSCESEVTPTPCDTCDVPCDTCDTTDIPCDTCDTTKPTPNPDSLAHAFTWTETTIPSEVGASGVMILSENPLRIYVLYDKLYEYDGSSWFLVPASAHNIPLGGMADRQMFGFAISDFWIAGGGLAYHINDDIYGIRYEPPTDGFINACWGTSSKDMYFVGNNGAITHFDGTTWTKMPRVTTKRLSSIWGTSHNNIWVGGTNLSTGEVTLLHFNGSEWTEIDLSTIGSFGCAGCESVASVWAVDSSGHTLAYVNGGHVHHQLPSKNWVTDSSRHVGNRLGAGTNISLALMRGNSSTDYMVAGDWGFVSHWNGKTWKRYDELFAPSSSSYATGAMDFKGNTACVVGTKSGQSWIAIGRRIP